MIDLAKYKDLLDEQINIICTDGQIISGEWINWTSELDNEPDPESITILKPNGSLIEIYIHEIKEIKKDCQ